MNDDEYDFLYHTMNDIVKEYTNYQNSIAKIAKDLISKWPENAKAAKDIVDSFDPNKYEQVVKFAEAANGNRLIK